MTIEWLTLAAILLCMSWQITPDCRSHAFLSYLMPVATLTESAASHPATVHPVHPHRNRHQTVQLRDANLTDWEKMASDEGTDALLLGTRAASRNQAVPNSAATSVLRMAPPYYPTRENNHAKKTKRSSTSKINPEKITIASLPHSHPAVKRDYRTCSFQQWRSPYGEGPWHSKESFGPPSRRGTLALPPTQTNGGIVQQGGN